MRKLFGEIQWITAILGIVFLGSANAQTNLEGGDFFSPAPQVIYGLDDRLDVYEAPEEMRALADSTVLLVKSVNLTREPNGTFSLRTRSLGQTLGLCRDERYYDQPRAGFCSGFLVAPNLIVTAGHCISDVDCTDVRFVFGFEMENPTQAKQSFDQNEVFSCNRILERTLTRGADYALVEIDRVADGKIPVEVRREGEVQPGEGLVVIGHPSGLPTKVAAGASVRSMDVSREFFKANLDTFGGNSGSAVFNLVTHKVEGILVRGENDYVRDPTLGCMRSQVCRDDACRGEDSTNIMTFSARIPAPEQMLLSEVQ